MYIENVFVKATDAAHEKITDAQNGHYAALESHSCAGTPHIPSSIPRLSVMAVKTFAFAHMVNSLSCTIPSARSS